MNQLVSPRPRVAPGVRRRLLQRLLVVMSLLCAGLVLPAPGAWAGNPDCTYSDYSWGENCRSVAFSPSSLSGSPWTGARTTMHMAYMASGGADSSYAARITSSLTVNQQGANTTSIQVGIASGWARPNGYNHCTPQVSATSCENWTYESGNGGNSTCLTNGCGAYFLYWSDRNRIDTNSGSTFYQYIHVIRFTSPAPNSVLYADAGWVSGGYWQIHVIQSNMGLDYYGRSTIGSANHFINSIKVGGLLIQHPNGGACANTNAMTFDVYRADQGTFTTFTAQAPGTAAVSSGFNGTQALPAPQPGTWLWNLPSSGNPNGC